MTAGASAAPLRPLRCPRCDAPVPLRAAASTSCPSCGESVTLPAAHVEALALAEAASAARRAAEPTWRAVAAPRSPRWGTVALGMVVTLPSLATAIVSVLPSPPLAQLEVLSLAALPALAPGAALFLWVEAVNATVVRVADALVAAPPVAGAGTPSCRRCGAPLTVEPESIAATCAYCGSDSLVDRPPVEPLRSRLAASVRTLGEATSALRTRRRALALGALALAGLLASAAALLWGAAIR